MTTSSRHSGFLLIEMVAAMALVVILVALFHASLRQIRRLETLALTQNRAQVVLQNVLERLEAEPMLTAEVASEVLRAEFEASSLSIPHRFYAECIVVDERLRVQIVRADQRPVALVEIGP